MSGISKTIDDVKHKIEGCILRYMSLEDTITYLYKNHCIPHQITATVWEHLQRESPIFFEEYNKRCELARQIALFNDLLAKQKDLMPKFKQIDFKATASVTKLQQSSDQHHHHHLDQIHYQRIEYHDFSNREDSDSSLIDSWSSIDDAPVTKLQKPNDQIHDQRIGCNDFPWSPFAAISESDHVISFDATPQSDPFTYGFSDDIDCHDPDLEQFAKDLDEQQQRMQLKVQSQQQPQHVMDQQQRMQLQVQSQQQPQHLMDQLQRMLLKVQSQQQPKHLMDQQQVSHPEQHVCTTLTLQEELFIKNKNLQEASNNLAFGDGFTNKNNGLDPTHDLWRENNIRE